MATVYVLTQGSYSDYQIVGVFSTEEGARRAASELAQEQYVEVNDLETYELDEKADWTYRTTYQSWIDHEGAIVRRDSRQKFAGNGGNAFAYTNPRGIIACGKSGLSPDHADKLAIEGRQFWLRELADRPAALRAAPPDANP
jgi:hypothetical protein